jgi:hypothetical protein
MTGGSDGGQAVLAVLLFGILMVSLYLVVRSGVRAGMEDAWKRLNAGVAPTPPAAPPAPEQRAPDASESEATEPDRAEDAESAAQ